MLFRSYDEIKFLLEHFTNIQNLRAKKSRDSYQRIPNYNNTLKRNTPNSLIQKNKEAIIKLLNQKGYNNYNTSHDLTLENIVNSTINESFNEDEIKFLEYHFDQIKKLKKRKENNEKYNPKFNSQGAIVRQTKKNNNMN